MSINNLIRWLYFAAVPLALLAGATIAVSWALYGQQDSWNNQIRIPSFSFTPARHDQAQKRQFVMHSGKEQVRDMFKIQENRQAQEESLALHEIALGLIILKNDTRICITNKIKYMEGQSGPGFTVNKIESQGVWYQVGTKMVFLQTGTRIHVDDLGNIHEPAGVDDLEQVQPHK